MLEFKFKLQIHFLNLNIHNFQKITAFKYWIKNELQETKRKNQYLLKIKAANIRSQKPYATFTFVTTFKNTTYTR